MRDRAGHDRRYAVDSGRARAELEWVPRASFERGLAETVSWYHTHSEWWGAIKSREYRRYYEAQYHALS